MRRSGTAIAVWIVLATLAGCADDDDANGVGSIGDEVRSCGEGDLIDDLKELLSNAASSSDSIKDLSIAAMLGNVMTGADSGTRPKIQALVDKANELGLGSTHPGK